MMRNVLIGLAVLLFLFYAYWIALNDPAESISFSCPVFTFTGMECAGCGSQRAFHELMNGRLSNAISQNALLFLLMPYAIMGMVLRFKPLREKYEKLYLSLFGSRAAWILLFLVLAWTLYRNLYLHIFNH